ncbi:hypothetical protein GJ744_009720 [Endocarpon pusillum]|uniref:Uncharacterized protein n=1 Tax=Endocarpon pusillum TaxID=364733 RepID=A0A8H7AS10_9EURO|nr:hypothetical protein GJ744_009720 [Endocarpon pusillum]
MAIYASRAAEDGSGDTATELQPMPNAVVKEPPAEAQTVPTLNVQEKVPLPLVPSRRRKASKFYSPLSWHF